MESAILEVVTLILKLNVKLTLSNARHTIGIYRGNKESFQGWMNALEAQIIIHSFSDENIIKLVLLTTEGSVKNFIMHFLEGNLNTKWSDLKEHLLERYTTATTLNETVEVSEQANTGKINNADGNI